MVHSSSTICFPFEAYSWRPFPLILTATPKLCQQMLYSLNCILYLVSGLVDFGLHHIICQEPIKEKVRK